MKNLPATFTAVLAHVLGGAILASCSRTPPTERVVWTTGAPGSAVRGAFTAGDVTVTNHGTWIAYAEAAGAGASSIRLRRAQGSERVADPVVATFEGASPGLLALEDGTLALASLQTAASGEAAIFLRQGSSDGRTWSAPRRISARPGRYALASGRLVHGGRDTWLLPATWTDAARPADSRTVVCLHSEDAGATWNEAVVRRDVEAADPAIAVLKGERLLLVFRQGTQLVRSTSVDGGASWDAIEPIGVETDTVPHALEGLTGGFALAWTDPPPDSAQAAPGLRALRFAVSTDVGRTWHAMRPLAWRAGAVPVCSALAFDDAGVTAFFASVRGMGSTLACVEYDLRQLDASSRTLEHPRGRYSIDPTRAADALELLCTQTLERPAPSQRLFIEGYFMRALVAAHEVLAAGSEHPAPAHLRTLDTQEGLVRAISFADWMLNGQDADGYWPLGYRAVYVADMAAVVGLFAALAPHVEAERARRYETAAARFATALERDGMLLSSGACGIGWPDTRARSESLAVRTPYLVSTALAGIEVHAWLYARTQEVRWRDRAFAALEYTLAELRPDGSFPAYALGEQRDGDFLVAAYVEEGWMAADRFLADPKLRERWRRALPPHVAWLLRTQKPNGTWGAEGVDGEYARTPAILSFLIWYDERVERRDDVRRAVQRASVALVDPDRWRELGLSRAGKHEDVLRAISGRPLAALAADRFVF